MLITFSTLDVPFTRTYNTFYKNLSIKLLVMLLDNSHITMLMHIQIITSHHQCFSKHFTRSQHNSLYTHHSPPHIHIRSTLSITYHNIILNNEICNTLEYPSGIFCNYCNYYCEIKHMFICVSILLPRIELINEN